MSAEKVPFDRKDPGYLEIRMSAIAPVARYVPFCSKRCADIDLHRWLGGIYVVPDDEPGQPDLPPEAGER